MFKFKQYTKDNESQWIDALINVINQEEIDLVLPGLDFEIPALLCQ